MTASSLSVRGLSVAFGDADHRSPVVSGVDLDLEPGMILGLAGEYGCGKSTTALAMIGYRPPGSTITAGVADYDGADLLKAPVNQLRSISGRQIGYVAQSAATALNPALTIGRQLADPLRYHLDVHGPALRTAQLDAIEAVGLPDPAAVLGRYPHEFSGGQQQRLAIAIALVCQPGVLLLDEPTTGLDVTTQARITKLLREIVKDSGMSALYVSHDLALLGVVADRLAIMYAGEVVERGEAAELIARPRHPYTQALLSALPSVHAARQIVGIRGEPPPGVVPDACAFAQRCTHVIDDCRASHVEMVELDDGHAARCIRVHDPEVIRTAIAAGAAGARSDKSSDGAAPVLQIHQLRCEYRTDTSFIAVRDVSLDLYAGETVGIVGESGSGKSTLLQAIVGLHRPASGTMEFHGSPLAGIAARRPREVRKDIQIVFQDPGSSLNPRQNVRQLIRRPIRLLRDDVPRAREDELIADLLEKVQLPRAVLYRYPWELSGGQRQRVAVARAFAADPAVLLCDEVTSALDVSVQAVVLEILTDLAAEHGTAVVFVSHDLAVVRTIADRAIVMRSGEICESGSIEQLFTRPSHPYTTELLSVIPDVAPLGPDVTLVPGPPGEPQ